MTMRPRNPAHLPDRLWSSWSAEPALHEDEEHWFADDLVTVAGEAYPSRFRIAVTTAYPPGHAASATLELCLPLCVYKGGFRLGQTIGGCILDVPFVPGRWWRDEAIASRPLSPNEFGKALCELSGGGEDGSNWEWVAAAWSFDKCAADQYPYELKKDLSEIKRRLDSTRQEPRWDELAAYVEALGHLMSGKRDLQQARREYRQIFHISRSTEHERHREAREAGLLSSLLGHPAHKPVPMLSRHSRVPGSAAAEQRAHE